MKSRITLFPALLMALLVVVALGLTWWNLNLALPRAQWGSALIAPDIDNIQQMLFHYSLLPRLAISLLVGAGLGLVGVLFQQVLRNPLAEPTTLGVATGAQLGMTIITLWALPGVLAAQFAALVGACVVGAIVFGVAWGKRLSPVTLILAGLVVSLYCGAVNQLLVIFHHDQLQSMFLWSTGTLTQTDWSIVQRLWPQLLGGVLLTLLLLRPLTLMGLDDGVARNLGLALSLARLAALTLAIVISALLVNAVGIIGFIGLFAPLLAKMLGARRLLSRLILAPLIGALILWLSDQVILWLTRVWVEVSTGSVTALIGAPLLLWLLPRLRSMSAPAMNAGDKVSAERHHVLWFALAGGAVLMLAVIAALAFGRDAQGWHWASGAMLDELLPWRAPRIFAALIAGVMLAVAGCIIQRLTGNPMASPEVLGISSGAAFGVVLMLFFVPGNAFGWLMPAGSIGAAVTLLIIMIAAGRGGFSPHRMLLAGMALSTAFTMLLMMLQASGDPRMAQILTWISGSTYNATTEQVVSTGVAMIILLALVPLCRRWLTVLPLGGDTARSVGMALSASRIGLLLLAASLTATATLTIGPLSFIGLMAPHIARMMGFRRTMPHIVMSAFTGGILLVFADWCGRMVLFPYQIPAGLLSTFIGAPYFIYLLRKQSR
ncbi:Fe(3+)-hydroxamate ABC transporter permease FhuB [Leclercia adecarboxylata]|jgi:iron complex transport system permease protein|uniref:Fe(3+)-hydroxamate ABC transporter permease FhuB n=1 Tax=Leclercia adecarboxylata TaxID=83655 RepID=A0ABU6I137_9ENTR|nr:Fe(3+)-hydroxamate ABC transporter permease FhuB [Leclercia adecarboxylata]MDQ2128883.1 Fe(3+)-hydroxamate ABC transporter permease FhuB [Leclercia adecarboxylata]MDV7057535.1 Fe(3+)-hydroxamate ABC transporter permease FhuB [Leclercia adecarboxylata]MEC3902209.1 Fe(3+)-hydroxamate ABC transporter permease FhuB [Leclercia adecarboxylata]MEC3934944.1 Fe(3+)-hydroxamate ABC transporter permease FhuB [Leclercia adecarboxylata]QEY54029.1 Fe(3+)-hydroxamate ABC transporter permease FhuB [Leclerc